MTQVPIDDTLTITVSFDIADRAEGYEALCLRGAPRSASFNSAFRRKAIIWF